jgi:Castor and Pollux, part of voltage-gated ion channel/Calcium-activated potassium channel slowpoke-like RCK domain
VLFGALRFVLALVAPETGTDIAYDMWVVFLQLTDPGNMNQDNDTPAVMKSAAVVAGLTGVVIFSALIAFLTTALDQAIGHLKKGHSQVLESGHTLILGWGPRVIEILRELVEANESEPDPVVVILSEEPKELMDEFLRDRFRDRRNTRVVTRSGPTASVESLKRVSAAKAKSAIVLASSSPSASLDHKLASDARIIKTVLALESIVGESAEFTVVAEVFTDRNRQVVKDVAPGRVSAIDVDEILAKIMVQTSRTSGLAVVYSELLSFEGCEMYLFNDPRWAGIPFDRLQYHFGDGVPIGIRRPSGEIVIRPPIETVLGAEDEILIVPEDDSSIVFQTVPVMVPRDRDVPARRLERRRERQLILGWSYKAPIIIREYADYVLEESEVDVMVSEPPPALRQTIEGLDSRCGVRVRLIDKDPLSIEDLRSVDPFSYHNVVILPQKPHLDAEPERIDSETIVVLLHLRKLRKAIRQEGRSVETRLITEVLESANRELVSHAGVDDFIISNRMVSMVFAQISEEPDIERVYDRLFEEEGSEIYVKPAELYFEELPVTCRFGDLMRVAQKRGGEICIGYKLKRGENDPGANYGVELIPAKDAQVTIGAEDALVVVAEDDC